MKSEVFLEGCDVGTGDRDIARLHGHKLFVCLKIIIGWEYLSSD